MYHTPLETVGPTEPPIIAIGEYYTPPPSAMGEYFTPPPAAVGEYFAAVGQIDTNEQEKRRQLGRAIFVGGVVGGVFAMDYLRKTTTPYTPLLMGLITAVLTYAALEDQRVSPGA